MLSKNDFMVIIKGTPDAPKCKFSRELVERINELNVKYASIDILTEPKLRWWLRYYSK